MINRLKINGFKSHKETELRLGNLTILCGGNGVGKSAAIQSLLLLRESYLKKSGFEYLDLLSNPIRVGTLADAIYYKNSDGFSFEIDSSTQEFRFNFENTSNDLTKTLIYESKKNPNTFNKSSIINESLFNTNFQYISAARQGPQLSYPKDDVIVDIHKQISVVEGKAEFTIHFLYKNQSQVVHNNLLHPEQPINDLIFQTSAWEKEISEGVNIEISDIGKLGYELKFRFDLKNDKTPDFSSTNVGFGITYVLPIIVALLSAKVGSLIIVENPEAHLHPYGISKLTELICKAAQSGIQVIMETHSDHVINGVLVQSKLYEDSIGEIGIDRKLISIYQLERDLVDHSTKSININIEEGGTIYDNPNGFFDQIDRDIRELL